MSACLPARARSFGRLSKSKPKEITFGLNSIILSVCSFGLGLVQSPEVKLWMKLVVRGDARYILAATTTMPLPPPPPPSHLRHVYISKTKLELRSEGGRMAPHFTQYLPFCVRGRSSLKILILFCCQCCMSVLYTE